MLAFVLRYSRSALFVLFLCVFSALGRVSVAMIGTCIMPKLLEPHENQCDSMIFCLLFFLHLAPVRSTFDFIIALILFSFFSFRKSIAILPVFLSRYFLCFYCCCCCCFYSVRKINGSDFQTLFNGTDNLYVHLFVCFALLCACTSVDSQFYRLFPVFDSLLLFIIRCRCCCCCCWPLSSFVLSLLLKCLRISIVASSFVELDSSAVMIIGCCCRCRRLPRFSTPQIKFVHKQTLTKKIV